MSNHGSASFDPATLVQQATQALQQGLSKPFAQAQAAQPLIEAFSRTAQALAADPHALLQRNLQLHQSQLALMANVWEKVLGKSPDPIVSPDKDDRRFNHESWDSAFFDLLKQSYLLTSNWLMDSVASARGLDEATKMKTNFYTRQFVEAMSPSNFLPTNPEALSTALATKGESLLNGFNNMLADLQRGRIAMTDYTKFTIGENLAATKGEVVFRNRLIELIQYTPTTKQVHAKPLVICPPWINRFYILDLKPENSYVKYMVDQGFTVFIVSWKNPTSEYRDVGFEDYIAEGLFEAIDAACSITGEKSVNAVGYCIGGTMLASALAVMEAKKDKRVNSATFFTTLTDFAQAGELGVFIDEQQISQLEQKMEQDGYLDGRSMAATFSMLRANDLIWSFVVSNYLLGKQPFPFDILYWNDDSTRMPAKMHSWYLRQLYMENNLVKGKVSVLGTPVNLEKISLPLYMVSAINDHITPWASCYAPYATMASPSKRFVLSKAGHVAGVVNPPTPAGKPIKRSFWAADIKGQTQGESWLKSASEVQDSWWPDYVQWLKPQSGSMIDAPKSAGNKDYKPLCAAPGTYVLEK